MIASGYLPAGLPPAIAAMANGGYAPPAAGTPIVAPDMDAIAAKSSMPGNVVAGLPGAQPQTFGQKFSAWFHDPKTSAMLLRSAAATLNGGLGAGLEAATGYADQQKAIAAHAQQQQFENTLAAFREQIAKQQADATAQHYARSDTNDAIRIGSQDQQWRAQTGVQERNNVRDNNTSRANNITTNQTSMANNASDNATSQANNQRTTSASMYGSDKEYQGKVDAAGIGSKAAVNTPVGTIKQKGKAAISPWPLVGGGSPATPDVEMQVYALPANPQTLQSGRIYQTGQGNARYVGNGQFVPIQ